MMMEKHRYAGPGRVVQIERVGDICTMELSCPEICASALPGQFVMVRTNDDTSSDPLLPRPFSIHRRSGARLIIIFKIMGRGTDRLARLQPGKEVQIVGPLGNGFTIEIGMERHLLVGGGMGIAPLHFLAETIRQQRAATSITVLLGARTAAELEPFNGIRDLPGIFITKATDDGSAGHHGFVTDLLASALADTTPATVYCCGPQPMMAKVAEICRARQTPCQVSLEAHMACGIGACLGCALPGREKEKNYLHVCIEGPVFTAERIWP
ncbi:MAG: dihydroorotate dehydrogenase electron transfer subunit [Thermodesulfobacteriota bacterium]